MALFLCFPSFYIPVMAILLSGTNYVYLKILFSLSLQFEKKKDLSDIEDITFAMRNRQEWFNEKMAAVSPEIVSEVQLSADIIARIDTILKRKNMTQKDLARKMGRSEAAISRWTTGFPNLTLKSIAEISTALGEPLVRVAD